MIPSVLRSTIHFSSTIKYLTCLNLACKVSHIELLCTPLERCTQSSAKGAVKKKGGPFSFYSSPDILYICHPLFSCGTTLRALHLFLTHFGEESLHSRPSFSGLESRPWHRLG